MLPPAHRAASGARRRRPGACGCRPSRRPRSKCRELAFELLHAAARARRRAARMSRASACVSSAACRPRIASRARKPGERRPCRSATCTRRLEALDARRAPPRAGDRCRRSIRPQNSSFARHDELRRRRRRRRAHVGHEVGDRHVGLVADRRDDRHRHARDRARDDLFVERPEILDRTAAAADDDDVDARHARDRAQRRARFPAPRPRPARARGGSRDARSRSGAAAP